MVTEAGAVDVGAAQPEDAPVPRDDAQQHLSHQHRHHDPHEDLEEPSHQHLEQALVYEVLVFIRFRVRCCYAFLFNSVEFSLDTLASLKPSHWMLNG